MVEELAEERRAGRLRGVVRVVRAQRQVDDQLFRPCRQRVVRIEKPTWLAELDQRSLDPSAVDGERRQPEDPPEVISAGVVGRPACRTARGGTLAESSATAPRPVPTAPKNRLRLSLRGVPSLFMLRALRRGA
jgi:hypothetical protein